MKVLCMDAKAALFTAIKNRRQAKYPPVSNKQTRILEMSMQWYIAL